MVDATPSNALIRHCFPGRSDLFGCSRSKPSQGSVPFDSMLANNLAFKAPASRLRPWCCVDPLRPPRLPGLEDYFWFARYPSRVDAKRGDRFSQADLSLPIGPTGATSGLPTTRELTTIKTFSVVIGAVRSGTKLRGPGSRLVSAIACFTSTTQPQAARAPPSMNRCPGVFHGPVQFHRPVVLASIKRRNE